MSEQPSIAGFWPAAARERGGRDEGARAREGSDWRLVARARFGVVPRAVVAAPNLGPNLPFGSACWTFFSARGFLPLPLEHWISLRAR